VAWAVAMANGRARADVSGWARDDVGREASAREGAEAVHGRRGVMAGDARRRAIMSLDHRGARVRLVARVLARERGAGEVWAKREGVVRGRVGPE
jgi:Mg-chelatase subunit ChlI